MLVRLPLPTERPAPASARSAKLARHGRVRTTRAPPRFSMHVMIERQFAKASGRGAGATARIAGGSANGARLSVTERIMVTRSRIVRNSLDNRTAQDACAFDGNEFDLAGLRVTVRHCVTMTSPATAGSLSVSTVATCAFVFVAASIYCNGLRLLA